MSRCPAACRRVEATRKASLKRKKTGLRCHQCDEYVFVSVLSERAFFRIKIQVRLEKRKLMDSLIFLLFTELHLFDCRIY